MKSSGNKKVVKNKQQKKRRQYKELKVKITAYILTTCNMKTKF